ncbi:MAG: translocation/assembly module TamB domain-containing protein [Oxalobacter formigenes]|nr:translocation/assembly module TamB domain-containing protein [Oxalobacter formigenes]
MRRYFIIPAAVFFAFVTALAVLANQEFALQWLAGKAVEASRGSLALRDVGGTLAGTITIGEAAYRTPEKEIAVQDVEITWHPLALLLGKISVASVSLSRLSVDLSASDSDEPAVLPESLALPLPVEVDRFLADKVIVRGMLFQRVQGSLFADGHGWRLVDAGFESDFGQVTAGLELGTRRPFPVKGEVTVSHEKAKGRAELAGGLEDIRFEGSFDGFGAAVKAYARITPFAAFMLPSLSLKAENVDFSQVRADWPAGRIQAEAEIQAADEASLKGRIRLANGDPGQLDANRLPVKRLEADLGGNIRDMLFEHILVDLGRAGRFDGRGRLHGDGLDLQLRTARLDLNGLYSRARSTAIAGSVQVAAEKNRQTVIARLAQRQLSLDARAVHAAGKVDVPLLRLFAGKGELQLAGSFKPGGSRDFAIDGTARRFDLSALGRYPVSYINASLKATGRLAADKAVSLDYALTGSRLMGKPLTGKGHVSVTEKALLAADVALAWGRNRFYAGGALNGTGKALQWSLDAPELALLGQPFQGALSGEGRFAGSFSRWQAYGKVKGEKLVLPGGISAAQFAAEGRGGNSLTDPLNVQVELAQVSAAGSSWQAGKLAVDGSPGSHVVQMAVSGGELDLHVKASGGWKGRQGWAGRIETLENRGNRPFSLLSPAPLQFGRRLFSLTDLRLGLPNGELAVRRLEKKASRLRSEGYAKGLPLAYVSAFVPSLTEHIGGRLTAGATWSVDMDRALDGRVHLYREEGDVLLRGEDNSIRLGLSEMDILLALEKNGLQFDARINGRVTGKIGLTARTRLARGREGWHLPKQSPFSLQLDAVMPALEWIGPASGQPDIEAGGSLKVHVTGSGTVGAPLLAGSVAGEDLAFRWATWGVRLHGGQLLARMDNGRVVLEKAMINGDEGSFRITGGGLVTGNHASADLHFLADRLLVMSSPDKQLALSGQGRLAVTDEKAALTGKWRVDKALIRSLAYNRVSFSDDVVIAGREPDKKAAKPPLPVTVDMQVDLGDKSKIDGWGLDARLLGSLQAVSSGKQPLRVYGAIRAEDAVFSAYGQKLEVKRGNAVFGGAPENPSLDILAIRKIPAFGMDNPVEAGVQVRGTPHDLQVKLVSNPDVPDEEKLSWLILGHGGAQNADGHERDMIATAAAALLSTSSLGSVQSGLASRIGVDDIGIGTGQDMESTVISVSKQISSRLYLTYEQGVSTVSNLIKLRYLVSDRLRVEAATGTDSAIDLLYEWSFD